MMPLNPPVRVSMVYAGCTVLLSERGHQMCLVKLVSLNELYGTEIFAVDKVTGEMYAMLDGAVNKIDLQAYMEDEGEDYLCATGFVPTKTSTPKNVEILSKLPRQSGRPSELSVIEEQSEITSQLTQKDFRENREIFKEMPSILSAGEVSQEIMKEEVDKAYKKKKCFHAEINNDL